MNYYKSPLAFNGEPAHRAELVPSQAGASTQSLAPISTSTRPI